MSERFCCNNVPSFRIVYDDISTGSYEVLVCVDHVNEYPFDNKMIVSKESIK